MKWGVREVRKTLGGKLIGNLYSREIICKTLLLLPQEILEHICKTVWFISSPDDAWALTFRGFELKERDLIFISDDLFKQPKDQVQYTILHEVGHVVLNHQNSIGRLQTQSEIKRQEREADLFAKKILATTV